MRAFVCLLLFCSAARAQEPSPSPVPVRLQGEVMERGTRTPLAGVHVFVVDGQTELAHQRTDERGGFAIALPAALAGTFNVILKSPGHRPFEVKETLAPRQMLTVRYALSRRFYYESTVRGRPAREEVARVSLEGDEVRRIPGTKGDALAAAFNLPSVARSPFDLGQLILRGSAPGESGAFLLGMEIPQAFHFGGLTSTFNSFFLERFDLIPSNFGVRYGRFVGGLVDIQPRDGKRDRIHGDLKVDLYDAHALVEGPLKKGSFALGLRRSYVDAVLGVILDAVGQPTAFSVAPRYWDYQAMLDYPVAGGKLKLLIFGSDDELDLVNRDIPENDPALRGRFKTRLWFHTLWAQYRKTFGRLDLDATLSFGPRHSDATVGLAARFNLDVIRTDIRFELRYRVSKRFKLTMGLDLQTDYFWVTVDAPRPVTEERVQGPLAATDKLHLSNQGFEASPALYVAADLQLHERVLLIPGVRVDWFSGDKRTYAQPRMSARIRVAKSTWLKLGAGLYHQPPQAPYGDAVLGNPRVHAQEAWHVTAGVESRFIPKYPPLRLEMNLFYKDLKYIAVNSDQLVLRGSKIAPEAYSDEGIGRVYGADIFLKHDSNKYVYGWISYTLMKSERRDHAGEPWRPFQYDQTHILTLIAGTHLPWEVDVAIRLRYVTGNPETQLFGGIYDADRDVYVSLPAPPYTGRLPDFFQLDFRIDKRFIFKTWILALYIDITNITNRRNVEAGYTYSFDYTRRASIGGLPILPSLGLRASF